MKKLDEQITMIERQISELRLKLLALTEFRQTLNGEPESVPIKKRASNVKPLVLEIMSLAGKNGASSSEVFEAAHAKNPAIGRDTISSVLSRLKGYGALVFDGDKYYEKSPTASPISPSWGPDLRAVN